MSAPASGAIANPMTACQAITRPATDVDMPRTSCR